MTVGVSHWFFRAIALLWLRGCAGRAGTTIVTADEPTEVCSPEDDCLSLCDEGDLQACTVLGQSFETDGALDEAVDAFGRGCEFGDDDACVQQVRVLRVSGREGEADRIISEVCGSSSSGERCRQFILRFADSGERAEAEPLLQSWCESGDPISCRELGRSLASRGEANEAVEPLEDACEVGDLQACLALAETLQALGRGNEAVRVRRRAEVLGSND